MTPSWLLPVGLVIHMGLNLVFVVLCWRWRRLTAEATAALRRQGAITKGLLQVCHAAGIRVDIQETPDGIDITAEGRMVELPQQETRH